jgi:hypothetical protein
VTHHTNFKGVPETKGGVVTFGTPSAPKGTRRRAEMRQRILITLFVTCCVTAVSGAPWKDSPQEKQSPGKAVPKSGSKPAPASLTGCVDQAVDGQFTLIHEKSRETVAKLVAEGFQTEGFAKHLGQKVTVRGTASPNGTSSEFRVRSIEAASETCAPQ